MKNLAFPIGIVVVCAAIVGGVVLMQGGGTKVPVLILSTSALSGESVALPVTSKSEDGLRDTTLIPAINKARAALKLPALIQDEDLTNDAFIASSKAQGDKQSHTGDGEIVDTFETLSGTSGNWYYSSNALVNEWMKDPAKRAILTGPGTKIGVWGARLTNGSKSVPLVTVIIR